jgi:preprotein translocase subunit SecA
LRDIKLRVRSITETIESHEKEGAFMKATAPGAISLMIRDYGRGTDFKCFDPRLIDAGGVHVIQAFFSNEIAEEVQIKGRTARQGGKGSYRYVSSIAFGPFVVFLKTFVLICCFVYL